MSSPVDAFAEQRRTVTVIQRTGDGRDVMGNATFSEQRVDVPGCLIAWTGTEENSDAADRVSDSATVYDVSRAWPPGTVHRVEIDGQQWEVEGSPQVWPGSIGGTVIQLRKVRG